MSTLAPKTEQRAIDVLAQCLPYFDLLANLKMTSEDDLDAKQAENFVRRIIGDTKPQLSEVLFVDSAYTEHMYVLIRWPWVQELMDYERFQQECFLYHGIGDQDYFSSSYFVPLTRLIEINQPGYYYLGFFVVTILAVYYIF